MQNFEAIVAMSERQTGRPVKIFRSDAGSEFTSNAFENWLSTKGIKHELSAADNQWQNGVAERTHRTLMEMALAMLTHARMARRWWAEAVNTAAFICNRILHTTTCVKTPIELFTGHVPTLANMRVFGCKCFNMVKAPERRNKLAPKATLCVMVGYMDNMKAYKLYDVENNKMIHGVHVKFLETEFFGESDLPDMLDDDEDDSDDDDLNGSTNTDDAIDYDAVTASNTIANTPPVRFTLPVTTRAPIDPPKRTSPFKSPPSFLQSRTQASAASFKSAIQKISNKIDAILPASPRTPRMTPSAAPPAVPHSQTALEAPYFVSPRPETPQNSLGDGILSSLRRPADFVPVYNEQPLNPTDTNRQQPTSMSSMPHGMIQSPRTSGRNRKPPARFLSYANGASDAPLEGYQWPDDNDDAIISEDTVLYRVGGIDYACAAVPLQLHPIPNSHKEAMASPDWRQWKAAEEAEVAQLLKLQCWTVSSPPKDRKIIGGRWTYARKTDAEGNVVRWKARWVLKGFNQIAGVDYDESSSNVIKMTSVRAICAVATARDMVLEQADAINAYIQAKLERPIWAVEPEGHETSPGKSALVVMALYGLNQSGHEWETHCKKQIAALGWKQSPHDPCVFTRGKGPNMEIMGTYVDDFIVAATTQGKMDSIMNELSLKMNLKRQGPLHYMLGVRITRDASQHRLTMTQDAYADKVLERFNMTTCHPVATPEVADQEDLWYDESQPSVDQGEYRAIIGSLVYLMVCTRPDIAHAVQRLSCHLHAPRAPHLVGAKRVLRYLAGTKQLGIQFGNGDPILTGFCDASWATRPDRRSTTGFCWMFLGGMLMWKSVRQRITALSSCESEYIAAAEASRESVWLNGLMRDLGSEQGCLTLFCDNMSAIATANSTAINERTKHIDVRHHYLRELVRGGVLSMRFVPTTEMVADALTKTATKHSIQKFTAWTMVLRNQNTELSNVMPSPKTNRQQPPHAGRQSNDLSSDSSSGRSNGPSSASSSATLSRHQG
jgi:hypothetical protein